MEFSVDTLDCPRQVREYESSGTIDPGKLTMVLFTLVTNNGRVMGSEMLTSSLTNLIPDQDLTS
jgi:hypothetical protein